MTTKELLIVSAGRLFAEKGYDAVSTRMIAEEADVKLSLIHYHFGSKENLYLESFKYARKSGTITNFSQVTLENPDLIKTPEGQAEIIRSTVYRRFYDLFNPDRPTWVGQVIIREAVNPSSAIQAVTKKVFKPDNDAAVAFYKRVRQGASDDEAYVWADLFHSSIFFYAMARGPLKLLRGNNTLDMVYFRRVARVVSRAMISELELPMPEDLKGNYEELN